MSIAGSGNLQLGLMAATLLAASMWSGAAFAYTPEQQQACTGDAMRICGAFVPDVDRITACMIQNKSQLSPGCRVYFRAGPEPDEVAERPGGRPMAIKPAARKPKKPAKPET
jgi:hypothetical protein